MFAVGDKVIGIRTTDGPHILLDRFVGEVGVIESFTPTKNNKCGRGCVVDFGEHGRDGCYEEEVELVESKFDERIRACLAKRSL